MTVRRCNNNCVHAMTEWTDCSNARLSIFNAKIRHDDFVCTCPTNESKAETAKIFTTRNRIGTWETYWLLWIKMKCDPFGFFPFSGRFGGNSVYTVQLYILVSMYFGGWTSISHRTVSSISLDEHAYNLYGVCKCRSITQMLEIARPRVAHNRCTCTASSFLSDVQPLKKLKIECARFGCTRKFSWQNMLEFIN